MAESRIGRAAVSNLVANSTDHLLNEYAAADRLGLVPQLLDHQSEPVPGITVRLSRGAELLNVPTDEDGVYSFPSSNSLVERVIGRLAATAIAHPETGEIILDRNEEIDEAAADRECAANEPSAAETKRLSQIPVGIEHPVEGPFYGFLRSAGNPRFIRHPSREAIIRTRPWPPRDRTARRSCGY